jgi:hypothetical protein
MVPFLATLMQHVRFLKALQQLALHGQHSRTFSLESMPGLSKLAALTKLTLTSSKIDVDLLLPCTQLKGLVLSNVNTVQEGGALLSCIARMTGLQVGPRLQTGAERRYSQHHACHIDSRKMGMPCQLFFPDVTGAAQITIVGPAPS